MMNPLPMNPTMTNASFEHIRQLVHRRAGIFLEPGKEYLVDARVLPIAKEEGCASIDELVCRLQQTKGVGALSDRVVEALTTNETSFFRDVHPFNALKTHVLPELIKARASTKTLRIWCAAASTGQEPYSIAMTIREHFPEVASSWNLRIIATDINRTVLARAREGVYRQLEVNRGLPALMLVKHFEKAGLDWRIKDAVRQMVTFEELNLLERFPTTMSLLGGEQQDIIFIRNVLIYFDTPTKKEIFGRLRQSMRKDGVLFLGGAETTNNIDDDLVPARVDKTITFRHRKI
jgi:chemotaxis protein methyltransferase CheR